MEESGSTPESDEELDSDEKCEAGAVSVKEADETEGVAIA